MCEEGGFRVGGALLFFFAGELSSVTGAFRRLAVRLALSGAGRESSCRILRGAQVARDGAERGPARAAVLRDLGQVSWVESARAGSTRGEENAATTQVSRHSSSSINMLAVKVFCIIVFTRTRVLCISYGHSECLDYMYFFVY